MNVLFVGDVAGKVGREALAAKLPELRVTHDLEVCVANVENSAGGFGVTPDTAEDFVRMGFDAMTSGNHIWDKKEIIPYLRREGCRLLRPHNLPPGSPGSGVVVFTSKGGHKVAVVNLIGRLFMQQAADCPFRTADAILGSLPADVRIVLVDMHGEATSEKQAIGWHLAGRASAVVGTHTHVQTSDEKVLPPGTAYITDLGLTGPHDGVIGLAKESALTRFLTQMPHRAQQAEGNVRVQAAVVSIDAATGRATGVERLDLPAS
ncbi:MAG: TIGR00282 family metallophosphoesterase [Acidobacteriota bacterium]